MKVIPYDSLFRVLVEGDSGQPPYLVDLEAFWGNGQCDCWHFKSRKQPLLALPVSHGGARPADEHDDQLRCKHIVYARHHLGNTLIQRLIDERQKAKPSSVDPCEG